MNLCQLNTFFLTFWPSRFAECAKQTGQKVRIKVFNWQRFICTEVTSYKIHTLGSTQVGSKGYYLLKISLIELCKLMKVQKILFCSQKNFTYKQSTNSGSRTAKQLLKSHLNDLRINYPGKPYGLCKQLQYFSNPLPRLTV